MEKKKTYLLIGLPETGKSTYLAALWSIFNDMKIHYNSQLKSVPKNVSYLNKLSNDWLTCEIVNRNNQGKKHERVSFDFSIDNELVTLNFSDCAGEYYKRMFLFRKMTEDIQQDIKNSTSIVLFLKGEEPLFTPFYSICIKTKEQESAILPEFNLKDVPDLVKIVEVLQLILKTKKIDTITIVVSQWDQIDSSNCINPEKWVEENYCMLYSFIKNNFRSNKFCGVSAQGGKYTSSDNDPLLDLDPEKRVKVKIGDNETNDILYPFKN